MQHTKPALGIGNLLTTCSTNFVAHITVHDAAHQWHRSDIVHTGTHENLRLVLSGCVEKTDDFFRQMLTVSVEQYDVINAAVEPIAQPGFNGLAFATILWMHDDVHSGRPCFLGRGVSRAIINDKHMFQLSPSTMRNFGNVCLFLVCGNDCSDSRTVPNAVHYRRTTGRKSAA